MGVPRIIVLAFRHIEMQCSSNPPRTRHRHAKLHGFRHGAPPVDLNKVLKERYRVSPAQTLTRDMIWDMETKKAWDPLTYIPYVVSQARSWAERLCATAPPGSAGRHCSADGSRRRKDAFLRMFSSAMPSGPSIS
jgi:hypothetical protein